MQALVDEGLVKVEKIGSGNWYWSCGGEERHARDMTLQNLQEEQLRWEKSVATLENEMVAKEMDRGGENDAKERTELNKKVEQLKTKVSRLKNDLERYGDTDPKALETKQVEIGKEKDRAERWTDNCLVLEGWLKGTLGADREALDGLQRQCYGDEYAEGEGLKEW